MVLKNFEIAGTGNFEMYEEIREQKEKFKNKLV